MAISSTIANLIVKVGADISGLTSGLGQAQSKLDGFASGAMKTGMGVFAAGAAWQIGIGNAAKAAVQSMISDYKDYEEAVQIMKSVTQDLSASIQDSLAQAAISVGADTDLIGIDAMEAMEAITGFLKSGLEVDEIFGGATGLQDYLSGAIPLVGALREAIDLAAASDVELAQAQQIVTRAMHVFGLGVGDVAGIADILVKAADASSVEVSELADALDNVGPIAAGMKIPIGDLAVAMAILGDNGKIGSEGGTALRSMLMHIAGPSDKALGLLKDVGVSFYDIQGNLKPLPEMFGELKDAMSGMTQQEADKFLHAIFGTYGQAAARIFLETGTAGWEAMASGIGTASGASDVAAVRTDSFARAMENLQGAIQTFNIVAGGPLVENVLVPLVKTMTEVISHLATAHPGLLKFMAGALLVAAALGPILITAGSLITVIGGLAKVFGAIGGITKIVGGGLALLAGPAGPILLLVAALGILVLAWTQNWGDIQGVTRDALAKIGGWLDALDAWMLEVWASIRTGVVNAWNGIRDALYNAGKSVIEGLAAGIRAAVGAVTGAVSWVLQQIRSLLPGSDAKEGPLSDLFASGRALPETFAKGILSGQGLVQGASMALAGMSIGGPSIGSRGPVPIGAGGGFGGGAGASESKLQNVNVNIYNPQAERSSLSTMRALRNLSALGVLLPSGA